MLNNNALAELRLRSSKTDTNADGAVVELQALDTLICPVKRLRRYIAMSPSAGRPFFGHFGGQLLTRSQFNSVRFIAHCALVIDSSIPLESAQLHWFYLKTTQMM